MYRSSLKKTGVTTNYQSSINNINLLENYFKTLTDSEIRFKYQALKKKYFEGSTLKSLLEESFALTREASIRTLGMRHFDVQLMGGFVLNSQKIAEMRTGEGKTLVATLAASLNAITEKGVHLVTVNDYLANRDQVSMGQIYRFLGLTTGLIKNDLTKLERKKNYAADITYVTNYELTFDFLRDNTTSNKTDVTLRPFNYCIIDEVDSILIDEAQTPLILANPKSTLVDKYIVASELMRYLLDEIHYKIDEKNKNVVLTEKGSKEIERILGTPNLYNPKDPWIPYVINAIKAHTLFSINIHYIVKKDRIVIVDEFTGRIMPDRRWGDGLHQAIEAKEKLPIGNATETQATITYQNFFLFYPKLAGMTGTGKTAEIEFEKIYNLSVEVIPTSQPTKRYDLPDFIYKDQFSKWKAIAGTCTEIAATMQPIVVGTTTVEKSEMLTELLHEYNLSCQVLNAKPENVSKESEIIAQAGRKGMITIATNIAGRGTDIVLGGNINFKTQKDLYIILVLAKNYKKNLLKILSKIQLSYISFGLLNSLVTNETFLKLSDIDILKLLKEIDLIITSTILHKNLIKFLFNSLLQQSRKQQAQEHIIVKNLGGLYIVGTERNDSRRIDDQLRGRCGRQGDPGTSRFFLSLDDNLLRLFGGDKIRTFLQTQIVDDAPLESKLLTRSLDLAQQRIEERAYQQRKSLFDYDEILNKQRQTFYFDRRYILNNSSVQKTLLTMTEQLIIQDLTTENKQNSPNMQKNWLKTSLFLKEFEPSILRSKNYLVNTFLLNEFWLLYQMKKIKLDTYGSYQSELIGQMSILINLDQLWKQHLQKLAFLKEAVGWRSYGQENPLYAYNRGAFKMFKTGTKALKNLAIYSFLRSFIL